MNFLKKALLRSVETRFIPKINFLQDSKLQACVSLFLDLDRGIKAVTAAELLPWVQMIVHLLIFCFCVTHVSYFHY